MGYAMASNVRRKMSPSATLFVNDIYRPACEHFAQEYSKLGPIKIVNTAKEAAKDSKIIISIVPSASDVRKVYLDRSTGVVAAPQDADRLMLECSTIDSQSTREVGENMLEAGSGTYVDTPVSV